MIVAMCAREIADLFNNFDPMFPVPAADKNLYVDWQQQVEVGDVRQLTRAIAYGEAPGNTYFLTGHRGVGKTTELFRVKQRLEDGVEGKRFFVSMLLAERWLDLVDVEPEDLVFQIVRQLVTDLGRIKFEFDNFTKWFTRMRDLLRNKIDLETIEVGTDPLRFTFKTKDLIGARSEFREILRGQLPTLYDLVNDELLTKARPWLKCSGFSDILIIVDQTDHIPENILNGQTNHEKLFINRAGTLRAIGCNVLYTLPIELFYSPDGQGKLKDIYGTQIRKLPIVPVTDRHGDPRPSAQDALKDIVKRRVEAAGFSLLEVFETDRLLEDVILVSGGHIRGLFVLLRSMLDWVEVLPIGHDVVTRSLKRAARDFSIPLRGEDWDVLDEVHRTKQRINRDDTTWYRLVRGLYVLVYQEEGGYWYDRNPLLSHLDAWARPPGRE